VKAGAAHERARNAEVVATWAEEPQGVDRTGLLIGWAIGTPAVIIVAALLAIPRSLVNGTNAALVLMIVVVAIAAIGGRTAGILTALAAVMSFDFFLTKPYLSLKIESRNDLETAIALLVAAVIVGTIASSGQLARRRVGSTNTDIRRIHRVAEAASAADEVADVIAIAQDELRGLLHLRSCRFEAAPYADGVDHPRLSRNGAVAPQPIMRYGRSEHGAGFELPEGGAQIAVLARGEEIGRFVLEPELGIVTTLDERVVAVAIADQVGAVWGRPSGLARSRLTDVG
jgi:K+-sensing histidine kinase KdpD